jgi:glycosyltransferase involved in cell wall biosynthesis
VNKPRLHILNTEKTMNLVTLVESNAVREVFEISKSRTIPRNADIIFTQTYGASDVLHVLQLTKKPYVVHMGGDPWNELQELRNRLLAVDNVLRRATAVVANSSFLYGIVCANGLQNSLFLPGGLWGFDETSIGVNPNRFKPKESYAPGRPFTILMAISLTVQRKYRGIYLFMEKIRPFLKGKKIHVLCAGTVKDTHFAGKMKERYKIRFLGKLENWAEYLPSADIFVHPSLFDCFPRALAEAKCAGLPSVAFNAAGNSTVGEAPVYCNPTSEEELCSSLEVLFQEEGLREYLGKLGRANSIRKTEAHRKDYAAILKAVLDGEQKELFESSRTAFEYKEVF